MSSYKNTDRELLDALARLKRAKADRDFYKKQMNAFIEKYVKLRAELELTYFDMLIRWLGKLFNRKQQ